MKGAIERFKSLEDLRAKEIAVIQEIIEPLNLRVHEIKADGSCLYNAISDQLKVTTCDNVTGELVRYSSWVCDSVLTPPHHSAECKRPQKYRCR